MLEIHLPRRNSSVAAATAGKEVLTLLVIGGSDVVVDRLTRRRHMFHLQADDDAASQLAIDGQIEHRKIARSSFDLQFAPNRPNVFGPSGGFAPVSLPLLQGSRREAWATRSLGCRMVVILCCRGSPACTTDSLVHQKSSGEGLQFREQRPHFGYVWSSKFDGNRALPITPAVCDARLSNGTTLACA